jgi:K+-transporting ATPase KdpF subunit
MDWVHAISAGMAIMLMAYLLVALLKPEWFS